MNAARLASWAWYSTRDTRCGQHTMLVGALRSTAVVSQDLHCFGWRNAAHVMLKAYVELAYSGGQR